MRLKAVLPAALSLPVVLLCAAPQAEAACWFWQECQKRPAGDVAPPVASDVPTPTLPLRKPPAPRNRAARLAPERAEDDDITDSSAETEPEAETPSFAKRTKREETGDETLPSEPRNATSVAPSPAPAPTILPDDAEAPVPPLTETPSAEAANNTPAPVSGETSVTNEPAPSAQTSAPGDLAPPASNAESYSLPGTSQTTIITE
jgi:hypothetical protein